MAQWFIKGTQLFQVGSLRCWREKSVGYVRPTKASGHEWPGTFAGNVVNITRFQYLGNEEYVIHFDVKVQGVIKSRQRKVHYKNKQLQIFHPIEED